MFQPNEEPTLLGEELLPKHYNTLQRTLLLQQYSQMFVWYMKQQMIDSKAAIRMKRIPRPFPLEGYHLLFDKVGSQTPPSIVSKSMLFESILYIEDLFELDNTLPEGWRTKEAERKDSFLRISSISRNAKPEKEPEGAIPSRKRKPCYYLRDIPFKVVYDVGASTIIIQFCYHKILLCFKDEQYPMLVW